GIGNTKRTAACAARPFEKVWGRASAGLSYAQVRACSKIRRNESPGAMHMVRYVSRKGSHLQILPLISHRFFSFLATLEAGLPLVVRALAFSIAAVARRF